LGVARYKILAPPKVNDQLPSSVNNNPCLWILFQKSVGFFSAIDEQVGEKGKKVVYYVYFVPKSPYKSLRFLHAVSA